jgi:hypothetical protein
VTADDVRARAIEAAARAVPGVPHLTAAESLRYRDEVAAAMVDAVEPILKAAIRADERRAARNANAIMGYMAEHEAEVRERIAQEIEARYSALNGDIGPSEFDEGLNLAARIARGTP